MPKEKNNMEISLRNKTVQMFDLHKLSQLIPLFIQLYRGNVSVEGVKKTTFM